MASKRQNLGFFFVIAIALVCSSMTQFRIPGLPVGASEFIIIICILIHLPLGNGVHGGNQPRSFIPILFLLLLATLPGYFVALVNEGTQFLALYNLVATTYVLALFTYLHFGYSYKLVSIEQLAKLFLLFSMLYFCILIILVFVEPTLVYVQDDIEAITVAIGGASQEVGEPIYRLYGFSLNPNQLALHAIICTFLVLALWKDSSFIASLFYLLVSVAIGLLTRSDAYVISAVALIITSIFMGVLYGKSLLFGLMIVVPLLAAGVVFSKPIYNYVQQQASASGQDETRITLWKNGLEAGLERPLIGLGPGAWSGFEGPKEEEESHNSVIDYFTNGGLIGLTVLLFGIFALGFKLLFSGQSTLLAGFIAIFLFAMFHNVLRQPLMWFGLYFIAHGLYAGAKKPKRRRKRMKRSSGAGLPV